MGVERRYRVVAAVALSCRVTYAFAEVLSPLLGALGALKGLSGNKVAVDVSGWSGRSLITGPAALTLVPSPLVTPTAAVGMPVASLNDVPEGAAAEPLIVAPSFTVPSAAGAIAPVVPGSVAAVADAS
ncbi:MAG: hypothetical protein ACXWIP_18865, partial [Burkholderiales bacterium]